LDEIVDTLFKEKMISQKQLEDIESFMDSLGEKEEKKIVFNSQIEKIQELIKKKNSRLIYTVEAQTQAEFFEHLKLVAEKAIIVKTNVNYIYDMSASFVKELVGYIKKYDFLILEDRHFVNPSSILKGLYLSGNVWSDFVSMHALTGTDVIQNLFEGKDNRSAFLYAKLSANANLMNDNYTRQVFEMGSKFHNRVSGYFCEASSKEELQRMRNKIAPYQLMVAIVNENMSEKEALAGGADLLLV
jgi:orotidine-5'-phosphate decarboxylase